MLSNILGMALEWVSLDFLIKDIMTQLLKNIEFVNLKKHLEKEYGNIIPYFRFAITDFHFNCKQRSPLLTIDINYYNSEKKISLIFNQFQYYLLSDEGYTPHFDNEGFSGFAFVSTSNESAFVDLLKKRGFDLQFELRNKNPENFFIFRVIAQNYFIDVFTDELPEIKYGS